MKFLSSSIHIEKSIQCNGWASRTWEIDGDTIATADAGSDFWRKTHHGFIVTGDVLLCDGRQRLRVTVKVAGGYRELYDQCPDGARRRRTLDQDRYPSTCMACNMSSAV